MSAARRKSTLSEAADVFSALGDATRLTLVERLKDDATLSATQLGEGIAVTRQAVAKHLKVLEDAGVLVGVKHGRERLYSLDPARVDQARLVLSGISRGWDRALNRLRRQVEDDAE